MTPTTIGENELLAAIKKYDWVWDALPNEVQEAVNNQADLIINLTTAAQPAFGGDLLSNDRIQDLKEQADHWKILAQTSTQEAQNHDISRALAELLDRRKDGLGTVSVKPVTRDDTIAFLNTACRNWGEFPGLSASDVDDVTNALSQFVSKRLTSIGVEAGPNWTECCNMSPEFCDCVNPKHIRVSLSPSPEHPSPQVIKAPWPTQPMVFLTGEAEGVLFDPQGRFHGWVMRQHPDGMWVSVRKLDAVDPEDNPLTQMLKGQPS